MKVAVLGASGHAGSEIVKELALRGHQVRAIARRPAAIRQWLIDRYGSYISYDPPLEAATWPLWLAPILLLALGGWIARGSFRRSRGR